MEKILEVIKLVSQLNFLELSGALVIVLNALIAIALVLPGSFPEKQLQGIVNFLAKFSKK